MTPTAVTNASESDRCMMTVGVEGNENWQGTSYFAAGLGEAWKEPRQRFILGGV